MVCLDTLLVFLLGFSLTISIDIEKEELKQLEERLKTKGFLLENINDHILSKSCQVRRIENFENSLAFASLKAFSERM